MDVRRTTPLLAAAALLLTVTLAPPAPAAPEGPAAEAGRTTGLRATFDFDREGFDTAEAGDPVGWEGEGGRPGGHFFVRRGVNATTGARSPVSWSGDRSSAFGGTVSFDHRLSPGATTPFYEVLLVARDGDVLQARTVGEPQETWRRRSLPLTERSGWTVIRPGEETVGARRADFEAVLGDLAHLQIAAFTSSSTDTLHLDNVVLASSVRRTTTIRRAGNRFVGRVGPAGSACVRGQSVRVLRQRPGPDATLGAVRTDGRGAWQLTRRDPQPGRYYARLTGAFVPGGGDCSGATSRTVSIR